MHSLQDHKLLETYETLSSSKMAPHRISGLVDDEDEVEFSDPDDLDLPVFIDDGDSRCLVYQPDVQRGVQPSEASSTNTVPPSPNPSRERSPLRIPPEGRSRARAEFSDSPAPGPSRDRSPLRFSRILSEPSWEWADQDEDEYEHMVFEVDVEIEEMEVEEIAPELPLPFPASPPAPRRGRENRRGTAATRRGRGSGATRGGRVSRVSRAASAAVVGDSGWLRGEDIIQVCANDEDMPPQLRELVTCLDESRARQAPKRAEPRRHESESEDDDEYVDAREDVIANEMFNGDRGAMEFSWSPMATFSGRGEEFHPPKNPGPNVNISCAYDAFRVFWDDAILKHIVVETNRYAALSKERSAKFAREWYDTNMHELLILFAFWMMLGIIRMPSIRSCFSNSHLLKTSIFRKMMTEARYWNLNRALHLVDNSTRTSDSSKLFCLGPVADHLNCKFKEAYTLAQNISIDESLTLWKGNLSFTQYIKTKAARFGIKTFELCESATGYLWSFIIYQGKDTKAPSHLAKSTQVVIELIRPLLNRGHKLFMDNWFNSPLLARFLKRNHTDCIGTLRKNKKNVPTIIQTATIPKGACVARHSGDVVVMQYHDKKPVTMITTCHGIETLFVEGRPGRPAHYRPAMIVDYNHQMGGVDKKDQMLEPYLIERKKNQKWYRKIFKRLLNVSINNSRIITAQSPATTMTHQGFRLQLVEEILTKHLVNVPKPVPERRNALDLPPDRLVGRLHFVVRQEVPDGELATRRTGENLENFSSKGRHYCLWCKVREGKRSKSVYMCKACEVPLCLKGCFENFHTLD